MARIRSIHPDVCVSPKMAQLTAELERTFFRLLTHCDDQGRAVDNTLLIKAALYPLHTEMTPERMEEELAALAGHGLICRYETAGRRCLCVTSWDEYQHPQRPAKPKLPAPSMQRMDTARRLLGGDMEMDVLEGRGRGDCADESATVPANPSRLDEVRQTLKAIR